MSAPDKLMGLLHVLKLIGHLLDKEGALSLTGNAMDWSCLYLARSSPIWNLQLRFWGYVQQKQASL